MLDDAELDAIEARANAATPAPWESMPDPRQPNWIMGRTANPSNGYYGTTDVLRIADENLDGSYLSDADAEFTAHAREDVPALLRDLRAARQQLAAFKSTAENLNAGGVDSSSVAELDGLTAEAWREARRGALSNFLFTIFNMGTAPNALREADLILEMLDAIAVRQQLALPVQDAELEAHIKLIEDMLGFRSDVPWPSITRVITAARQHRPVQDADPRGAEIITAIIRDRHSQYVTEAGGVAERVAARNAEFDEWFDSLRCPSISPSDQRCIGMSELWHETHVDRHSSTWRDYAAKVPGRKTQTVLHPAQDEAQS